MALLNKKNNHYIRIDLKGNYLIYKSKKARLNEKKVTSPAVINKKYWELLSNLSSDREFLYYSPNAKQYLQDLEAEHKRYLQNLTRYITTESYPLMKEYIIDVDDSIPQILSKGHVRVRGATLKEVYTFAKKYEIFGETEDC